MIPLLDMRLIAIRYVARDTHLFEFASMDGEALPAAEPGAHIDIHLPNGISRSYSLTTPESEPRSYTVGIKRDAQSRGGSKYIFEAMKVGQTLKISKPRNNFELVESAGHVVLIAGGIGITPIWSMTQRLASVGRPFELHYSCRSRADMAFRDRLQDMKRAHLHFDDENGGQFLDLGAIVEAAPKASHLYCCGPTPMLGSFESATKHLPPEQVHVEYFTPREEKKPCRRICRPARALWQGIRDSARQEHPRGAAQRGPRAVVFLRGRRLRRMRDATDIRHSRSPGLRAEPDGTSRQQSDYDLLQRLQGRQAGARHLTIWRMLDSAPCGPIHLVT